MASTDAIPVPRKGVAYRLSWDFRKIDGSLVSTVTGADTEVSKDAAAFADCTNEFTEIGTTGCGYIDLTSTEMNADCVFVKATCTNTDALPYTLPLYPEEAGDIRVDMVAIAGALLSSNGPFPHLGIIDIGTAQAASATTLTLRAGFSATDDVIIGATLWIYSSTNGLHERRVITDWVNSTKVATVDTFTQTPTGTILYVLFPVAPNSTSGLLNVNVTQISGDSIAADNLEAMLDGTGGVTLKAALDGSLSGSVASVTGLVAGVTAAVTVGTINAGALDSIWDEVVVGATTARDAVGLLPAYVASTPNVNVLQISGDAVAADRLEAALDGTGGFAITADLTGNVSGSVGSVTGAVGSVTGSVASVTGSVASVTGAVGSVTAAVAVATLSAGAVDSIHDDVVVGSTTWRQAVRLFLAGLAGKSSGHGTATVVYRDVDDTKNVITATVDASGNRSAVTRDVS